MGVFSKTIAGAGLGTMLGLSAFAFGSEDDDNQIYNLQATKSKEVIAQIADSTDAEKFNTNTMIEDTVLSFLPEFEGFGIKFVQPNPTPATNGSGLNLLLIQQMAEGYCKDYLAIAAEGESGELLKDYSWYPYTIYPTVNEIIAVNISETKMYGCGYIPWGVIPEKGGGIPMYYTTGDGSQYNLYSYAQSRGDAGGPFQYISGGEIQIEGSTSISKYNTSGSFDAYLFPDCVAGMTYYSKRIDDANFTIKDDNDTYLGTSLYDLALMICHNRGPGGLGGLYGIQYDSILEYTCGHYIKLGDQSFENNQTLLQQVYDGLYIDPSKLSTDDIISPYSDAYAGAVLVLAARGWYVDDDAYNNTKKRLANKQSAVTLWNAAGGKTASSINDVFSYLEQQHKSFYEVASSAGCTSSITDCDATFGTISGSTVSYNSRSPYGNVYTPTSIEIDYKTGKHKAMICLETINVTHLYNVLNTSPVIYAMMLCMGGNVSSVDPTNPDTYMITMELGDTAGATAGQLINGGLDSGLVAFMVEKGINAIGLNETRTKVLNLAWDRWVDIACAYSQGCDDCKNCSGNTHVPHKDDGYKDYLGNIHIPRLMWTADLKNTPPPKGLDCSGLIFWIYQTNLGYKNIPTWTGEYNKTSVKSIPLSSIKSGDIFWRKKHVGLFLGKANVNGKEYYVTMEYNTKDTYNIVDAPLVKGDGLTLNYHGMKLGYYTQKGNSVGASGSVFTVNYTVNGVD